YISSVTLAEVLFGIEVMPAGRRKNVLAEAFAGICAVFDQRILPFDVQAARQYAGLAAKARTAGKGFPIPDGYIAAIADAKGFHVASRDTSAFHAAGIPVVDPWQSAT
ncbi:MAG: type II toxin-antitoxin system VapC family toxin, partial [Mesorhizobium sp.]